jgi:hypothetical protein
MNSVRGRYNSLDSSNGNGSRSAEDDWLDENSTASENEWSTASTTFYYWEASSAQQQKFEALYNKHHGKGESDRKTTIRHSQIMNDAETFCSILEFPAPQTERVLEIVEEIEFSSRQFGGKPYEKILLAICSLVSDSALSDRISHKNVNSSFASQRIITNDAFRDLMEANNLGSKEHNRIRQMLREKTDIF